MAIRRTDIDIIISSATYQQKNDIPVWDAYVVQDMGLGIEEKVISLTREGDRLKTEYTSERAYINDGFEFLIECSDCKAITKVEKYGLSENKPYITRCSQCGKIFINPYYKDPVSESWEKNPPTQIVD